MLHQYCSSVGKSAGSVAGERSPAKDMPTLMILSQEYYLTLITGFCRSSDEQGICHAAGYHNQEPEIFGA
jgi:hypothetical protein